MALTTDDIIITSSLRVPLVTSSITEWPVLGHVDCVSQCEIVRLQVIQDCLHPSNPEDDHLVSSSGDAGKMKVEHTRIQSGKKNGGKERKYKVTLVYLRRHALFVII